MVDMMYSERPGVQVLWNVCVLQSADSKYDRCTIVSAMYLLNRALPGIDWLFTCDKIGKGFSDFEQ